MAFIGGGYGNTIDRNGSGGASTYSFIGGGIDNSINSHFNSFIGNGRNNTLFDGQRCIIIGGVNNYMRVVSGGFIGGGRDNTIYGNGGISPYSFIGTGRNNFISGSSYSSVITGINNNLFDTNHSHIIGSNITSVSANTTHVERFNIGTIDNNESLNDILVRDTNGTIRYRTSQSIADSFTGNTSGDCITDLYVTNLYGCSPITVHDTIESVTGIIRTSGGTGAELNLKDSFGPNGTWSITSDNGGYGSGSTWVYGQPSNGSQLAYQIDGSEAIGISVFEGGIFPLLFNGKEINIGNNKNESTGSGNIDKRSVFLGTRNSTMLSGVTNSVIIGGENITGSADDTVYTSNLNVSGNTIISGGMVIGESLSTTQLNTPTLTAGIYHDYDPGTDTSFISIRTNFSATTEFTGLANGVSGKRVVFYGRDLGAQTVTFKHDDTGSTVTNRFINGNAGTDKVMNGDDTIEYIYDSLRQRWVYIGGSI